MRKNSIFSFVFLSMALLTLATSCLKDGFDDFAGLTKPIVLEGDFNPNLGVPVGSATMTVNDMLNLFKQSQALVTVNEGTGLVTLSYDTTFFIQKNFADTKGRAKEEPEIFSYAENFEGMMKIDLLDSVVSSLGVDIQLQNIFVDLGAKLNAHFPDSARAIIANSDLSLIIDSINIYAVGKDDIATLQLASSNPVTLANFMNNDSVSLINHVDISPLINVLPNKLQYKAHYVVSFSDRIFANITEMNKYIRDSLHLMSVDLNADFEVEFPLSLSVNGLKYGNDVALNFDSSTFEFQYGDLAIDSSSVILEFDNNLPLDFAIDVKLLDTVTNQQVDLFDGGMMNLRGAEVALNSATNTYTATKPTKSTVRVPLDNNKLNMLKHSNKLRFNTELSTATYGGSHPVVSVQGSDALKVKVYIQVQPNVHVHIPLVGGNSSKK